MFNKSGIISITLLSVSISINVGCANYAKIKTVENLNCINVEVDELYMNYNIYNGKIVCTFGNVLADVGSIKLPPTDAKLTRNGEMMILLAFSYIEFLENGFKDGDMFNVIGYFSYDRKCFQEFGESDFEQVCAPYQYRMYIDDVTLIPK